MIQNKRIYLAGVFNEGSEFPYFESDGTFLSKNGRFCNSDKALVFESKQEVREFFVKWVAKSPAKRSSIKLHVSTMTVQIDDGVRVCDENHPLTQISKHCSRSISMTASFYFHGENIDKLWSESTLKKHRAKLLVFGVDINTPVSDEFNIQLKMTALSKHYKELENAKQSADRVMLSVVK